MKNDAMSQTLRRASRAPWSAITDRQWPQNKVTWLTLETRRSTSNALYIKEAVY